MSHLTDLAEKHGLVAPDGISETINRLSKKALAKLAERTIEAIIRDEPHANEKPGCAQAFLASSSIRSDLGCRRWGCRDRKLTTLSRFAALYSDQLLLPVTIATFLAAPEVARITLGDLYYKHSSMRPLFDEGLTRFVPDIYCLCDECARRFDSMCRMHDQAALEFYISKLGELEVIYRPPSGRSHWYIEITGPEQYIEHGCLHLVPVVNTAVPTWAPKRIIDVGGRPGAYVSASRIRKNRVGGYLFSRLSVDAVFQQYHGVRFAVSYITDSALETEFLRRVYPRADMSVGVQTLLSEMEHAVPLLADVPIRKVLSIRKGDYDSFLIYRNALASIVREHLQPGRNLTAADAKQLCADVLLPQLAKLRIEATAKRRSAIKKSAAKSIVPAAMLTLGLVSGLVPCELSEIFKWGGIAFGGQIAESLASIERSPADVRSHNLYFLLRLCRESAG